MEQQSLFYNKVKVKNIGSLLADWEEHNGEFPFILKTYPLSGNSKQRRKNRRKRLRATVSYKNYLANIKETMKALTESINAEILSDIGKVVKIGNRRSREVL